jgi:hypothetical protein
VRPTIYCVLAAPSLLIPVVLAETAALASGPTVARPRSAIFPPNRVPALRSEGGCPQIASEGRPVGYVATKDPGSVIDHVCFWQIVLQKSFCRRCLKF